MNAYVRGCGIALAIAALGSPLQAQQPEDLGAIVRRLEALENQVAELRRQAGIQTAVETVARELHERRPRFQKMRLRTPEPQGPTRPVFADAAGDLPFDDAAAAAGGKASPVGIPPAERTAIRIDGIEVTQTEVEDLRRFARSFVPGDDQAVTKHVLEKVLLPRCRAQAASGAAVQDLLQRASDLREVVTSGGRDFAEVARESSQDAATASKGGSLPPVQRSSAPLALSQACFETPVGQVSNVIRTELGLHFVLVERKGKQNPQDPSSPLVVEAKQIFLRWPAAAPGENAPRIELFDPSLRAGLPDNVQLTDRTAEFLGGAPVRSPMLNDDGTIQEPKTEDARRKADEEAAAIQKKKAALGGGTPDPRD